MHGLMMQSPQRTDVRTPRRNRYHFGQLLGVEQFELETDYFNHKRWLLNRLVCGYGVVCGLDVIPCDQPDQVVITPGVAIDKWGREIIVPMQTAPISIAEDMVQQGADLYHKKQGDEKTHAWVHVVLCYHVCESDPVPVMAGDCRSGDSCAPSTIRETYCVEIRPGRLDPPDMDCAIKGAVRDGRIDYAVLTRFVTDGLLFDCDDGCVELDADPCIPLANVRIVDPDKGHDCHPENVEIHVRSIVYTNDLLLALIRCMTGEQTPARRIR